MNKKLFSGALLFSMAALPLGGAEKIFDLSFDDFTVTPQISRGAKTQTGFGNPDLQLRMFKGINNKGNALSLGNRERLSYKMKGNFNPKEGTLIMWIAPRNWSISASNFQLFFHAGQADYSLNLAKTWSNYITAGIRYKIPYQGKKNFSTQVQARLDAAEWTPGRYHQVALTWNGETFNLYIDGKKPARTPIFVGSRSVPPTVPYRKFTIPVKFPEATPNGTITIGAYNWRRNKNINHDHSTAFDHITIYDKVLSPEQIKAQYEKILPPPKKKNVNFLTIPKLKGSGKITGDLSDPVWKKAAKVPMLPIKAAPDNALSAQIWHDGKMLYVGFSTDAACQKKELTQRDSSLWKDDAFEFHLRTADKNHYHYLVNGNAAIYDELNRKMDWNGKAKAAVKHGKKGWTAELMIPLSEFNAAEFEAEFCAGSRPGIYYHLYRWAGRGQEFGPAGKMALGKNADSLRIDTLGQPEYGKIALTGNVTRKSQFKIIKEGEYTQVYQVPAGRFTLSPKLQPGTQTLELSGENFIWQKNIVVRQPLNLGFDFNMLNNTLSVTADFSSAGEEVISSLSKSGLPLEITLKDAGGKTVVSRKLAAKKIKSEISFLLPADLTAGTYQLEGKSGKITTSIPMRRPDTAPYKAKLGADHSVPVPWTAVKKVSAKVFEVWNRRYEFADGPLPVQITHGREKLLKKAPIWSFNGKNIKWKPFKITAAYPDYIVLSGTGNMAKASVKWQGELHFDGAYILNMQLIPEGKTVISDFAFNYTVVPEAGCYAMNPEYVKWQNDKVELQLGPGKGRKENLLWLSGSEKGICIWTKSNANWVVAPQKAPLTAFRKADGSLVNVQIIGKKATLARTADYTFVFTATPTRPFPANYREINYGGWHINPYTSHQSIGWGQFYDRRDGDDPAHFNMPYPAYPERLRRSIAGYIKRNGARLHYYTMPGVLTDTLPDHDYWSKTFKTIPEESYSYIKGKRFTATRFCTVATSAPADYWTWTLDKLLKDFPGMGGLYFDCASTNFCANSAHGCSGLDAFGQPYVTSDALGLRDFMKRIYKVHKKYPNTSIMLHSHVQFLPFLHAFTDYFAPGENSTAAVFRNQEYPYTEEVSLEEYQTDYNNRKAGVAFCTLLQNARAAGIMPSLRPWRKRYLTEPEFAIRAITPFLLHDLNIWDSYVQRKTIIRYWKMRKDMQLNKATRFIGYWAKDCPVKSAASKIYCSVYEWQDKAPYRRAIVVGNFTRNEKAIELQIDWKALGVEKSAVLHELWTNKDVPVSELGQFKLKGSHFAVFGVK